MTTSSEQTPEFPAGPTPGDRHVTFLSDPIVDNLLRAVVTLTMELSVTRERLKSMEQVLEGHKIPVASEIDALTISAEDDAARRVERDRLVQSILAPIIGGVTNKS